MCTIDIDTMGSTEIVSSAFETKEVHSTHFRITNNHDNVRWCCVCHGAVGLTVLAKRHESSESLTNQNF